MRRIVTILLAVAVLLPATAPAASAAEQIVPPPLTAETPVDHADGVQVWEKRRLGRSVQGRPIWAYRVGDPHSPVKAVALGTMHGNEQAGISVVHAIRTHAEPISGVDLWLVPSINPDGVAANTRQNARGVDLNRNWKADWARLSGPYHSGSKPFSEPETRAFRDFLREVDPRFVVSMHQPLHGIGTTSKGQALQKRLAQGLKLPRRAFNCTGKCHGTMTTWFNRGHRGTAVTVEFGASPGATYLRTTAKRGVVTAVLGRF